MFVPGLTVHESSLNMPSIRVVPVGIALPTALAQA
jgi:hypothetical protein